jgi:transmembrane sensor
MKDFRLFDISDFVMDEDFIRWVYEKRKVDNDFWEGWLGKNPDKYMIVAEARRILESIGTDQGVIADAEIDKEVERLMQTIRGQSEQNNAPVVAMKRPRKWRYVAAAAVFLAVASVYLITKGDKRPGQFAYLRQVSSKHLIEGVNTSEKSITIRLPDGSIVELAPNSRISYPNSFDTMATRDVYLLCEAFFSVVKNPSRPFRVLSNEIVSKVVGTSFTVRAFEEDTVIQVTVRTGKVSVYSQTSGDVKQTTATYKPGEMMVMPNQQLLYKKKDKTFQKILLKDPIMIQPLPETGNKGYEDEPIESVFKQLSNAYQINIVYDSDLLRHCTISTTADFKSESFYQKIDLICKAIGARYEIIEGQIIIQSNGCQ